jgi:hypothetical protein|nr:MAG TPA: major capsid protein [Caudoviricetes sp.]
MAGILNMQNFTFCGEVIRAVNELLFDETIKSPEIGSIHQVWTGVVTDKEVGYIGKGGIIGVPTTGCDPEPQAWGISTRKVKWVPKMWEFLIAACWTDLENAASVYSLKTGKDIPDFTDSDYMAIVVEVLGDSLLDMMWRWIWFNDTAAKNVSDSGVITNGLDLKHFTLIDGLWKQIYAEIGGDGAAQHTATITENAGASYEAQTLNPENVIGYLQKVVMGAPLLLRRQRDKELLVTQSVYDAYQIALEGLGLSETYRNLVDGQATLSYNGIPLHPLPVWDEMIAEYENTGVKLHDPHRILFTTKGTLAVGVDSENSYQDFNTWYDRDSRKVKMEGFGRIDAKLANPAMFSLGI